MYEKFINTNVNPWINRRLLRIIKIITAITNIVFNARIKYLFYHSVNRNQVNEAHILTSPRINDYYIIDI